RIGTHPRPPEPMSPTDLIDALRTLEREALDRISNAPDEDALEAVRVAYLGRKDGRVSDILRGLGKMAPEARPVVGQEANRVRDALETALEGRLAEVARTE